MNPLMLQALEPFLKEYNGTPGNAIFGNGKGRKWSSNGGVTFNLFQMDDGTFDVYMHSCPNSDWIYNNWSPRWNKGSDGGIYFYGFTTPVEDNYEEFSSCYWRLFCGIYKADNTYEVRSNFGSQCPILPNWKLSKFKQWRDAPDNQKMIACWGYKSIPWGGSPNQIISLGTRVRNFWKALWGFRNIDYSNYEMIWKTYNKYPDQFIIKPQKISNTVTLQNSSNGIYWNDFRSDKCLPLQWNTDSYVFMNIMDFDDFSNNDVMIGNDIRCIASSKRCYYINPLIQLNKNVPGEKPYYYSDWLAHPTRPGNRNSPCWLGIPEPDWRAMGIGDISSKKQILMDPKKLREYEGYKIWKEINEKQKDNPVRVLVSFGFHTTRLPTSNIGVITFNVKTPMDRTLL